MSKSAVSFGLFFFYVCFPVGTTTLVYFIITETVELIDSNSAVVTFSDGTNSFSAELSQQYRLDGNSSENTIVFSSSSVPESISSQWFYPIMNLVGDMDNGSSLDVCHPSRRRDLDLHRDRRSYPPSPGNFATGDFLPLKV